jgi:hypothetical protein
VGVCKAEQAPRNSIPIMSKKRPIFGI